MEKSPNKIIRGVWIGPNLTRIQRLSIQSFLDNGHEYHLYTYDPYVRGIPCRATVLDANEIVPWDMRSIFQNDANFSDYFRSSVTAKLGGWYCDTDIVCLRPFDFEEPRVFVSEYQFGGLNPEQTQPLVNGCIIKIPAADQMTAAILNRISVMDTMHCGWCDVGPNQYRWGVDHFNYRGSIQPPDVFDSLWPTRLHDFVTAQTPWIIPAEARAIHLRTSYWKAGGALDPNGSYHPESWFEKLKRKHGIN